VILLKDLFAEGKNGEPWTCLWLWSWERFMIARSNASYDWDSYWSKTKNGWLNYDVENRNRFPHTRIRLDRRFTFQPSQLTNQHYNLHMKYCMYAYSYRELYLSAWRYRSAVQCTEVISSAVQKTCTIYNSSSFGNNKVTSPIVWSKFLKMMKRFSVLIW
jgi:hypothetical protein